MAWRVLNGDPRSVSEVDRMKRLTSSQSARALFVRASCASVAQVLAQTDALPSWTDGPAKRATVEFVRVTTTEGSANFVAPPERIATFDQDGTLWVEHPMCTQVVCMKNDWTRLFRFDH